MQRCHQLASIILLMAMLYSIQIHQSPLAKASRCMYSWLLVATRKRWHAVCCYRYLAARIFTTDPPPEKSVQGIIPEESCKMQVTRGCNPLFVALNGARHSGWRDFLENPAVAGICGAFYGCALLLSKKVVHRGSFFSKKTIRGLGYKLAENRLQITEGYFIPKE